MHGLMTKSPLLTNNQNLILPRMERRLFKAAFFIFLFMFLVEQGVHVFLEKEKELFIWTAPNVSDMIRTRDLLIRSQTLYPAELHSHAWFTQEIYYKKVHVLSIGFLRILCIFEGTICSPSKIRFFLFFRNDVWAKMAVFLQSEKNKNDCGVPIF